MEETRLELCYLLKYTNLTHILMYGYDMGM